MIAATIIPIAADAVTSETQWRNARTRETATASARSAAAIRNALDSALRINTPASANAPTVCPLGNDDADDVSALFL